ncbi:MAG: signal recognition particle-docking protein FtsY [Candidatus Woesearchaeota archaeon]
MFKFLKEKLKGAISKTAEEIEEKAEEEIVETTEEVQEEKPGTQTRKESDSTQKEKKGFFKKLFKKEETIEDVPEEELEEVPLEKIEEQPEEKKEEKVEEKKIEIVGEEEKVEEIVKEKKEVPSIQELAEKKEEIKEEPKEKGFFKKIKQKVTTKKINEKQFDDLFWNLEVILLENNIAVEVIEKIKSDLKENLVDNPIARGKIGQTITDSLKSTLNGLFDVEKLDILKKSEEKKPLVICFVGINGSGKTTTIAKITKMFQNNGKSVVLAAADTFRAAAIDQLQEHADKLGVKMIKHDYGSDAAAVAFDAVKHAEAKGIDIVLIDTAGRMHSNVNLMEEIEKLIRVSNPDLKIFVGESITGNDCTEQAKKFNDSVGLDGIVLSKADIDEKGGAAISISYVTGKPILFIGTGQEYEDLKEFDSQVIIDSLEL